MATMDEHGRQIKPGRSSAKHRGGPAAAVTPKPTKSEKSMLEAFDLNYTFGASNGISRLNRWERAERCGLNPPREVPLIIQQYGSKYNQSLWNSYVCGIKDQV